MARRVEEIESELVLLADDIALVIQSRDLDDSRRAELEAAVDQLAKRIEVEAITEEKLRGLQEKRSALEQALEEAVLLTELE